MAIKGIKKAPNRFFSQKEAKDFILECERDFEERFDITLNAIANISELKIIALSGPTCSGKTTAANKIISELAERGKKVNVVSIDDFYYDKEMLHKMSADSGKEEVDYDSAETIDISALGEFVSAISKSSDILCPVFDFHSGRRTGYKKISCEKDDVFIFEGIQAIYPEVTALLREHGYYSAYIAPHSALEVDGRLILPDELRLLRRIVRDVNFRSTDAEFTFRIWESVRNNEDKNIFPYTESCMFRIDSTFSYELGILKPYLERALGEIPRDSVYRKRADQILETVSSVQAIDSELLPENSLYREFV